ncbi:hypothetical protein ARAM_004107 [Aspergillus rambellii]|uniref:Inositol polyphosphate-related phosphatase domain-containing protein n=1 Tax=Aspergillus rambellii TaxID=308745 RepID=A0A0F8WRJ6_9EURO|nr:hypothetical protein ARAM_004107 [Aspergillus rambellii]
MDSLRLYILTFNCARNVIDVDHFSQHFFDALPLGHDSTSSAPPDILVLCLQEIAPIAYAFLGGSFLTPYFVAFAQMVDRAAASRWGSNYVNMVTDNSGMTGLMVFARTDIADQISSIDVARVGFGVQEVGNKGAVGARLSYTSPESPQVGADLTFIAAHLAPMEYAVAQRNADWRSIVERLVFSDSEVAETGIMQEEDDSESAALLANSASRPPPEYQGIFTPTSYLFLGGDLNYRTSDTSPKKEDSLSFPRATADPSSPLHHSYLLERDQLKREMEQSQCFQGLSEAPITFPPTYKYTEEAREAARDISSGNKAEEWKWTRSRWPSWCDRVLYLTHPPALGEQAKVNVLSYNSLPVFPTSDHRAVGFAACVPISRVEPTTDGQFVIPFPIDPEWERKRATARRKEFLVGCLVYLAWTWEGNLLVGASTIGAVGIWFVIRSFFNA